MLFLDGVLPELQDIATCSYIIIIVIMSNFSLAISYMNSQESLTQSKYYLNFVGDVGVNLGIKLDNFVPNLCLLL